MSNLPIPKRLAIGLLALVVAAALLELGAALLHFYLGLPSQGRSAALSLARHLLSTTSPTPVTKASDGVFPFYVWNAQLHDPRTAPVLSNPRNARVSYCAADEVAGGAPVVFSTDEYGFRNSAARKDHYDAVLIGDSFVEGACVADDSTLAAAMERVGVTTYLMGRAGSGPLFQLALLIEYAREIPAKEVVWVIFAGNDLQNLREEKTSELQHYLAPGFSRSLAANREQLDVELKKFLRNRLADHEERRRRQLKIPQAGPYGETLDPIEADKYESALFAEVLSRFRDEALSQGKRLSIVLLTGHPKYDAQIQSLAAIAVRSFASSSSVALAEVDMARASQEGHLPHHFDAHYYQLIGTALGTWIASSSATDRRSNIQLQ